LLIFLLNKSVGRSLHKAIHENFLKKATKENNSKVAE